MAAAGASDLLDTFTPFLVGFLLKDKLSRNSSGRNIFSILQMHRKDPSDVDFPFFKADNP